MNKNKLSALLRTYAVPAIVMIMGLILVLNPDSASILLAKVISWALMGAGICFGLSALSGDPDRRNPRIIKAAFSLMLGIWLSTNPLVLAKGIGRLIGILLLIPGLQDLLPALRNRSRATVSSVITTAVGAVLILLPMTTSRLILSFCGIALLGVGIAMAVDRFKGRNYLGEGDAPNIIDADV